MSIEYEIEYESAIKDIRKSQTTENDGGFNLGRLQRLELTKAILRYGVDDKTAELIVSDFIAKNG